MCWPSSTESAWRADCNQVSPQYYVMYEYLGSYRWSSDEEVRLFYACPDHVEQLAALYHVTASDTVPYDDKVPF
jgi:hypothetical protein